MAGLSARSLSVLSHGLFIKIELVVATLTAAAAARVAAPEPLPELLEGDSDDDSDLPTGNLVAAVVYGFAAIASTPIVCQTLALLQQDGLSPSTRGLAGTFVAAPVAFGCSAVFAATQFNPTGTDNKAIEITVSSIPAFAFLVAVLAVLVLFPNDPVLRRQRPSSPEQGQPGSEGPQYQAQAPEGRLGLPTRYTGRIRHISTGARYAPSGNDAMARAWPFGGTYTGSKETALERAMRLQGK